MNIDLVRVQQSEKAVLGQLLELYLYDFSEFDGADLNQDGRYGYPYLDNYWTEPGRHPFFIKVDSKLAGFVLINKHTAVLEPGSANSIAEFFVMRKYRGMGVGKVAAVEAFRKFPGRWEVRQFDPNEPSKIFWEKVIGAYARDDFQKQMITVEDWREQVIIFDNSNDR